MDIALTLVKIVVLAYLCLMLYYAFKHGSDDNNRR